MQTTSRYGPTYGQINGTYGLCSYIWGLLRFNTLTVTFNSLPCQFYITPKQHWSDWGRTQIDGLVQRRRNSIANALELRLSCTYQSISYIYIYIYTWIRGCHGFYGGHRQSHITISMITLLLVMLVMHTVLYYCILLGIKLLLLLLHDNSQKVIRSI